MVVFSVEKKVLNNFIGKSEKYCVHVIVAKWNLNGKIKKRIFNFCELEIKNEAGIDYYLDSCHKLNKNLNEQVENYDQVMEYLSKNLHT